MSRCTVIFVNSVTNETIDTKTVDYGASAEFPEPPQMDGYKFKNWSRSTSTTFISDSIIYANYVKVHKISFINGANNTLIKSVQVEDGGTAAVPAPPAVTGKKFTGWNPEEANSGKITNIRENKTVIANYANVYKITCIDGVTNKVFKTIEVEEGKSVSAPAYPSHYYDEKNPWKFYCWSNPNAFDKPVHSDLEVKAQYTKLYIVNWIDIYDGSIIKTERLSRAESATAPVYPSHTINGVTVTANDYVGYDDTSGDSKRNCKNVSDDKCDPGDARVISMYVIYPGVTHKIRIISSVNDSDVCSTFYVIDGGDGTNELIARSSDLGNSVYSFTGFTDGAGNAVTSLRNVRSDMDIIANFVNKN